jgi:hypothetical protein
MGGGRPTFLPTSASLRKNWAPRSFSVTTWWSARVIEPMPARTRFFATSLASALIVTSRMFALRILESSVGAHSQTETKYSLLLSLDAPQANLPVV